MSVDKIVETSSKVVSLVIGGTGTEDLFALGEVLTAQKNAGKVPLVVIMPTDAYTDMFDDGEFEENIKTYGEIMNRHTKAAFDEYAAWKVLRERARSMKK